MVSRRVLTSHAFVERSAVRHCACHRLGGRAMAAGLVARPAVHEGRRRAWWRASRGGSLHASPSGKGPASLPWLRVRPQKPRPASRRASDRAATRETRGCRASQRDGDCRSGARSQRGGWRGRTMVGLEGASARELPDICSVLIGGQYGARRVVNEYSHASCASARAGRSGAAGTRRGAAPEATGSLLNVLWSSPKRRPRREE